MISLDVNTALSASQHLKTKARPRLGAILVAGGGGKLGGEVVRRLTQVRAAYLGGRYDVPCSTCKGARVEAVVDRERANPVLLARLDADRRAEAESRAQERAERRMGA